MTPAGSRSQSSTLGIIELPIRITLPYLWGASPFEKNQWGYLNFLIGANGTGKSIVAEQILQQANQHGFKSRYLNAERLSGLERQSYSHFASSQMEQGYQIPYFPTYVSQAVQFGLASSAFVLLKQKLDLRTRIEATLSQLFGRNLTLSQETGFLKPTLRRRDSDEYDLKKNECHGLKELIALLTFLYDDEHNCLIIDEPELHLHPQYQTFFLQQLREIAGDPRHEDGKKCFFLITHSPYYVDVRTPEELRHCVVFHPDAPPTWVDNFDGEDSLRIGRLLPRLNTHHKQFFFACRPIFVEGYTDQQIFTVIQERRRRYIGAAGACFIDVTGKDELDLFYRFCQRLKIDAQLIVDLDALLSGRLRQSVARDPRCRQFMQREGTKIEPMEAIGEIERELGDLLGAFEQAPQSCTGPQDEIRGIEESLHKVAEEDPEALRKRRVIMLVAVQCASDQLRQLMRSESDRIDFISGRVGKVIEAFRRCGVFVLLRGQLENYLPTYEGSRYEISDKLATFEKERDWLLTEPRDEAKMRDRYGELLPLLDAASSGLHLDFDVQVTQHIQDWIYKVQTSFQRRNPKDADALKKDSGVEWQSYSRLFELVEFSTSATGFVCRVRLKPLVDRHERVIQFDEQTMPSRFSLPSIGEVSAAQVVPIVGSLAEPL